jgi:hypothetical protein
MPGNIYKFRRTKWADPNRFKVADFNPKRHGSRYFSGLVALLAYRLRSRPGMAQT